MHTNASLSPIQKRQTPEGVSISQRIGDSPPSRYTSKAGRLPLITSWKLAFRTFTPQARRLR